MRVDLTHAPEWKAVASSYDGDGDDELENEVVSETEAANLVAKSGGILALAHGYAELSLVM
jgi:hypothetical protein